MFYTFLGCLQGQSGVETSLMFVIIVFFSYGMDINMDRVEDVLLHQKLLASAKNPDNRPVFHIRFLEVTLFIMLFIYSLLRYWCNFIKKSLEISGE